MQPRQALPKCTQAIRVKGQFAYRAEWKDGRQLACQHAEELVVGVPQKNSHELRSILPTQNPGPSQVIMALPSIVLTAAHMTSKEGAD